MMKDTRTVLRTGAVVMLVTGVLVTSAVCDAGSWRGPATASAVPVPRRIGADSPVEDVLRFAETSGARWRTLRIRGRQGSVAAAAPFDTVVERPSRSRSVEADVVRVRDGGVSLWLDPVSKRATRRVAARAEDPALLERMAVHRADDPTLMRDGERLVDTPVNDLVSPAWLVRKELSMAAVSVTKRGITTVAGRPAVALEARFPAELAKEDHWDVYVDVQTGILLGLAIEPLPGGTPYELIVEQIEVDPAVEPAVFDTSPPAGYSEGAW